MLPKRTQGRVRPALATSSSTSSIGRSDSELKHMHARTSSVRLQIPGSKIEKSSPRQFKALSSVGNLPIPSLSIKGLPSFPGYEAESIIQVSARTTVIRARDIETSENVIIKFNTPSNPTTTLLESIKAEFALLKSVEVQFKESRIIKAKVLRDFDHGRMLVLEDIGGFSITHYVMNGFTLEQVAVRSKLDSDHSHLLGSGFYLDEVLKIMITCCTALEDLHRVMIVHKDITPNNIIVAFNVDGDISVRVIDLSIASHIKTLSDVVLTMEGTLSFMAPEQTGRFNRKVDYRSDLYGLGATFYYALTGLRPFQNYENDELSIVHAHLARSIVPPSEIDKSIPPIISAIVVKLMEKTPSLRYQTARGLKSDLDQAVADIMRADKSGVALFELGVKDMSYQFSIPDSLYGREEEISCLSEAFANVAELKKPNLVLVSGLSGTGKSRLVNEVDISVAKKRAFLVSGKCEQIGSKPMICFVQALSQLVSKILLLPEDDIERYRSLISQNVIHPGLITDSGIHEFGALCGNKPAPKDFNLLQAQKAFNLAVAGFIRTISSLQPVVLVLDDLQWADQATFSLLQALFSPIAACGSLLIIGTCREDEVPEDHTLWQAINSIISDCGSAAFEQIRLSSFDLSVTTRFVLETMRSDGTNRDAIQLANIIYERTNGNPFYISEMLKSLNSEGLIFFKENDDGTGKWCAALKEIRNVAKFSDNVINLVTKEIHKFDEKTLNLLQTASAIGSTFTLQMLAQAMGIPVISCISSINAAIMVDVIQPLSRWAGTLTEEMSEKTLAEILKTDNPSYKWLHDKTQQAAYETVKSAERPLLHLNIGRAFIAELQSRANSDDNNIFEVVKHYDIAMQDKNLVDGLSRKERDDMALTFLQAGLKAVSASAVDSALKYIDIGMTYLDPQTKRDKYDLVFNACVIGFRVGMIMLNKDFRSRILKEGLELAKDNIDKCVLITADGLRLIYEGSNECLARLTEALSVAGVSFPKTVTSRELKSVLLQGRKLLRKMTAEAWQYVGIDTDRGSNAICTAMRLLANSGYNKPVVNVTHRLLVRYQIENHIWSRDYRQYLNSLYESFMVGHYQLGEYSVSGSNIALWIGSLVWMGKPLHEIIALKDKIEGVYKSFIRIDIKLRVRVFHQVAHSLSNNSFELNGPFFGDKEKAFSEGKIPSQTALFVFVHGHAALAFWEKNWPKASMHLDRMRELQTEFGMLSNLEKQWYFLDAMCSLGMLHTYYNPSLKNHKFGSQIKPKQHYWNNLKVSLERLAYMAKWTPMTEEHRYQLVLAEICRFKMQYQKAMQHYRASIEAAEKNKFINEAGLAYELCAKCIDLMEISPLASRGFITEAYSCYQKWGATALQTQLRESYPFLNEQIYGNPAVTINDGPESLFSGSRIGHLPSIVATHKDTLTATDLGLDFRSLLKAAQDISDQTQLEDTMKKALDVALENSGAQRAILVKQTSRIDVSSLVILCESSVKQTAVLSKSSSALTTPSTSKDPSVEIGEDTKPCLPHTLLKYVYRTQQTLVIHDVGQSQFSEDPYFATKKVRSVLCTPLSGQSGKDLRLVAYLEHPTDGLFTTSRVQILNVLLKQAALDIDKAQTSEAVHRFVPSQLLDLLGVQSITDAKLGDTVLKQVSVFFADIRDFTKMSEKLTSEQNFEFVNALLSEVVPELEKYHLVVDKFIGDAIAGVAVRRGLKNFNQNLYKHNWHPIVNNIRLGMGIHSGDTILGLVGSKDRLNVTIISDTVNTASRIESITKKYGATLIISQTTYDLLTNPSEFHIRLLDEVIVKGKTTPLRLYEVIDADASDESRASKIRLKETYLKGIQYYWDGLIDDAKEEFAKILRVFPDDLASRVFFERCGFWIENGMPEEWDPVWKMEEK
ncbi:hypothetical protein HDU76_013193 [Blyttiomyces sp. JEL0837]|nr:hypothetical protein HDU76_013193 [Blyttiomyces sp. JEL0837]